MQLFGSERGQPALRVSVLSDRGRVHSHNEDACLADIDRGLFAVADGVGGQPAGDVAAQVTVQHLPRLIDEALSQRGESPDAAIKRSIVELSDMVQAEATGFQRFEQVVSLELGALTETITVASEAQLLQTDKADVSTELKSAEITNLPLNQFRNYQALINLVPGATPAAFQNAETDTPARSLTTNVNGQNRNNNATRIDGALSVFLWLPHHTAYIPPAETIETVNVSTNNFDAEQGLAGLQAGDLDRGVERRIFPIEGHQAARAGDGRRVAGGHAGAGWRHGCRSRSSMTHSYRWR